MQTFYVAGADCPRCKEKIEKAVGALGGVSHAHLDLKKEILDVEADYQLDAEALTKIVQKEGDYTITDAPSSRVKEVFKKYRPLIVVFALILIYTGIRSYFRIGTSLELFMKDFMFAFFILFGLLQAVTLSSSVETLKKYDPIAKTVPGYAAVYPFLFLLFGILIFTDLWLTFVFIATILILGIQSFGIVSVLKQGEKIQCACIGTAFALPLTWVTVLENSIMVLMAIYMLLLV